MLQVMKRLGRDEEGTALIEYSILLGVVALAAITAAIAIGVKVGATWTAFCTAFAPNGTCT